jgi:putative ABC transport system permease protein
MGHVIGKMGERFFSKRDCIQRYFFARVNAIQVLKNISAVRIFRKVTMRKALIVLQFTISLMFIAATIIGYKHYKHLLGFDLGFETENVLNIALSGNKSDLLKKGLSEMPEVKAISTSSMITSVGNYWAASMKYRDPQDSTSAYYTFIDEHYLSLHRHTLLTGRNFSSKAENAEESEVIVNETLLKRFNIANHEPAKAIGETITVNGNKVQIIGVVKDFYYGKSIDREIKEFMFRYTSGKPNYINAKVISNDWPATFGKIERAWKKIDHIHPLKAAFYDEQIQRSYRGFSSRIKVIGALSFLAICIASFGLLGMVVFTTETRLKEISIRKVLGAGEASLVYLLSKGFLMLLVIAALIALPAAQFFFVRYALDEYADTAPVPWNELLIGVMAVMSLAFLMIATHTLKVARGNPAQVLKSE